MKKPMNEVVGRALRPPGPGLVALLALLWAAPVGAQDRAQDSAPLAPQVRTPIAAPSPTQAAPPAALPPAESSGRPSFDGAAPLLGSPGTPPPTTVDTVTSADAPGSPPPPSPSLLPSSTWPAVPPPSGWQTSLYGFVELDGMHDSMASYGPSANNAMLARPGTFAAFQGRTQLTANNSQLGLRIAAPGFGRLHASGQVEADFFGVQPTDVTEQSVYTLGAVRMRLFYVKLETPFVDVLAGQYHDLLAWGGAGFYPNTVAFLGVPGQVYHRNPQIRLSKTFAGRVARVDIAAAAVRPAQRDAEIPDIQAGVRLAVEGWRGAGAQGFGQPDVAPLAIGLSGVARRFAVAEFLTVPTAARVATGWGLAANAFLPIIPVSASSADDRGNALTLTGEFTVGSGISDLYTQLTGGALFPTLPNPGSLVPPPLYRPNIDSGIVTYDGNGNLSPINWWAFVVGLQYYLPIDRGRLWMSATGSYLKSSNIASLTPNASRGGVFTRLDYLDVNLFYAITPEVQVGASYQTTHQVFGDTPFGGRSVESRNHRGEGALRFYF